MIKVQIKKNNIVTNQAKFNTQEEAEAWFLENKQTGVFGKPGGWYNENQLTTEEKLSAVEVAEVENPYKGENEPEKINIYKIEDSFTHEYIDTTLDDKKEERFSKGKKRQEQGASIIAQVYGINEEKVENGTFDNAKIQSLLADTSLFQIERFLFNGSLQTAKFLIQGLDNTFYTNDEKSFIIGLIDSYLSEG